MFFNEVHCSESKESESQSHKINTVNNKYYDTSTAAIVTSVACLDKLC